MLDLIFGASIVVSGVLLLLVLASVASWAVIAVKYGELRRADTATRTFLEAYHNEPLDAVYDIARERKASPLAVVFKSGFDEVVELEKAQGSAELIEREQLERVIRRLHFIRDNQTQRFERGLSFLATVGSSAPFVGLFGTVVGIMNSFQQIGQTGSASLAVVAPGIAEALIATAVGLFAAIPAVIAYNYCSARVTNVLARLDTFCGEFAELLREQRGALMRIEERKRRVMSEINVTPFVDVMLVLLIIFMVTAPLIQQGIEIELPKTQAEGLKSDSEPLVVTVKKNGAVFLQRKEVKIDELDAKLQSIFQTRGDKEVFLRADSKVAYGTVAKALAILRHAGASRIGMVTEPDA